MISEISTALATLTAAKDFTKAVLGSKVDAALREQAIQFQFSIIEIQTALDRANGDANAISALAARKSRFQTTID